MSFYGQHLFGQVDRVPGVFYVSTMFWHVNFLPLVPLRSHVVLEGTEKDEGFQGVRIPLNLKSVLTGYLRGIFAAAALLVTGAGAGAATSYYVGVQGIGTVVVMAVIVALIGVFWFLFSTRTWWFLPVQLALVLISVGVYLDIRDRVPDAMRIPGAAPGSSERRRHDASYVGDLLIGNAAALLYSLTRLLTPASYRRALALGRLVGIPEEQVAAHFGRQPAAPSLAPPGDDGGREGMQREE
jgi:hypothetical protein